VRGSLQHGTHASVDLCGLLRSLVEDDRQVGRPVRWSREPTANCTILGDRVALGRMIQNLIDNAVKYGGEAEVALILEGDTARIVIADRGPGLAAEDIEAMFAPFARQDPSRNRETGGAGLGLAIARAIARERGGEVLLAQREGGGLEATIVLPVAPA
jgi:signal transduction histidine kinase